MSWQEEAIPLAAGSRRRRACVQRQLMARYGRGGNSVVLPRKWSLTIPAFGGGLC